MHKVKIYLLLTCLVLATGMGSVYACQCRELMPLTGSEAAKYDVIFTGKVVAISGGGMESVARFRIDELFKGSAYQHIDVQYDAESDCGMLFNPGDTWAIYGKWVEYGVPRAEMCGHSRMKPGANGNDLYAINRPGFDTELQWLRDSIGVQQFLDPSEHKNQTHKNQLPDSTQAVIYIAVGLGGLSIIFLLVRKLFKRDAK